MIAYPDIPDIESEEASDIMSHPVTVVEKVDGDLLAVGVDEDGFVYGPDDDARDEYPDAVAHIEDALTADDYREAQRGDDTVTVFGIVPDESYPDDYEPAPIDPYVVIDVHSEQEGWLAWDSIRAVARHLRLKTAYAIYNHRVYQAIDELPDEPESRERDEPTDIVVRNEVEGIRAQKETL